MSRDRFLASAFFSITNSRAEQISLAVVDFTHFKRERSLKIDRATFCTEWKSALKPVNFIKRAFLKNCVVKGVITPHKNLAMKKFANGHK